MESKTGINSVALRCFFEFPVTSKAFLQAYSWNLRSIDQCFNHRFVIHPSCSYKIHSLILAFTLFMLCVFHLSYFFFKHPFRHSVSTLFIHLFSYQSIHSIFHLWFYSFVNSFFHLSTRVSSYPYFYSSIHTCVHLSNHCSFHANDRIKRS